MTLPTMLNRPTIKVDVLMTDEELRKALKELDLNQSKTARLVGVDIRTMQRWVSGETEIPPIAARFIRLLIEAKISGIEAAEMIQRRMAVVATVAKAKATRARNRRIAEREERQEAERRQEAAAVRKTRREAAKRSTQHAATVRHRPRMAASLAAR